MITALVEKSQPTVQSNIIDNQEKIQNLLSNATLMNHHNSFIKMVKSNIEVNNIEVTIEILKNNLKNDDIFLFELIPKDDNINSIDNFKKEYIDGYYIVNSDSQRAVYLHSINNVIKKDNNNQQLKILLKKDFLHKLCILYIKNKYTILHFDNNCFCAYQMRISIFNFDNNNFKGAEVSIMFEKEEDFYRNNLFGMGVLYNFILSKSKFFSKYKLLDKNIILKKMPIVKKEKFMQQISIKSEQQSLTQSVFEFILQETDALLKKQQQEIEILVQQKQQYQQMPVSLEQQNQKFAIICHITSKLSERHKTIEILEEESQMLQQSILTPEKTQQPEQLEQLLASGNKIIKFMQKTAYSPAQKTTVQSLVEHMKIIESIKNNNI